MSPDAPARAPRGAGPAAPAAAGEPYTRSLERMNRFQEPEGRAAIAALRLPRGSRGIDVGCGVGLFTLWLAEAVGARGRVVGLEPSAERVAAARTLAGRRLPPPRLAFGEGDATAIPAPDASVDWAWVSDALHHVLDTQAALREIARVVRPGGLVVVKESQVVPAMWLPGHPELERRLQQAELERSREESGPLSFQERRQQTLAALRTAGLTDVTARTYVIARQAPLRRVDREYVQRVVFDRNWGPRLESRLRPEDWRQRTALCAAGSPEAVLRRRDYFCIYPFTVFTARRPARAGRPLTAAPRAPRPGGRARRAGAEPDRATPRGRRRG
ncbi:MAG: methyltransferase domain-containing protein [Candidatus Rokubacteria bacterium]|nr:methyltransferase domain-containing protein [Candidatus Rokubacteria bacterium]